MKNKTICFIWTWLLVFLFPVALKAATSIDVANPDVGPASGWKNHFPLSAAFDPAGDTWFGSSLPSIDIVGDATYPAAYIQFNDDGSEIAVRLRVNGCDEIDGSLLFNYFAYIGIDANHNGTVDFFLGAFNPTGSGRLGIYPAHLDAPNWGAGQTGIANAPVATFQPVDGVNYSIMETQDGSNFSGNADYFITFKFNVPDITNAIAGKTKENVIFTAATPFTFITGTSIRDNILTGDFNGIADNDGLYPRWTELFPSPVSTDGSEWYVVTFDANGGEVDASPKYIPVAPGNALTAFPISPAMRYGYYFIGWSNIPNDIVPIADPFLLSTTINGNTTVYAVWEIDPSGYEPFPEHIVHFDPSGGSWSGGVTYYHVLSEDGSIKNMPPNPDPPINPPLTGNTEWVFSGWVKEQTVYNLNSHRNIIQLVGNESYSDVGYFIWPQLVTDLDLVRQHISGEMEYTVYALWLQVRTTGGNAAATLLFFDNIYDDSGQTSFPPHYGRLLYTSYTSTNNTPAFGLKPVTRQGYVFRGWDTKPDGTGTRYCDPLFPATSAAWMSAAFTNGNTYNFYAIWEVNNYAVEFLPNTIDYNLDLLIGIPSGNFGYALCPATTYGLVYPDLPNPPSLYGYTFRGWNTKPDGTGLGVYPYINNAIIKTGDPIRFSLFSPAAEGTMVNDDEVSQVLQLYALWGRNPGDVDITVTITFNAMGGRLFYEGSYPDPDYDLFDVIATNGFLPYIPIPVWTAQVFPDGEPYYVFAGWSFDSSDDRAVADPPIDIWRSDPRFLDGNVTVYAIWRRNFRNNIIINSHVMQRVMK
jgi:hypothetical protein